MSENVSKFFRLTTRGRLLSNRGDQRLILAVDLDVPPGWRDVSPARESSCPIDSCACLSVSPEGTEGCPFYCGTESGKNERGHVGTFVRCSAPKRKPRPRTRRLRLVRAEGGAA